MQRRLATIVAIDVAGYSARTEADEDHAASEIAGLSERVSVIAERHGGRVFNSAGDGFMLEFPTVSGALQAAEDLLAAPGPPLRIGVHLGEVLVTPTGDLLGHGVNVAARIQALAPPGGVLVSGDVRRALHGPLAQRLLPKGRARLDKMDETVELFALENEPSPQRLKLVWRPRPWTWALLAAAGAIAALALVGIWVLHIAGAPVEPEAQLAVGPIEALSSDPATRSFTAGLSDEIAGALSNNHLLTASAAGAARLRGPDAGAAVARLGAELVLDGSVERDGDILKVRIRLDDPKAQVTLWSAAFSGPTADPAALQTAVAAKATDMAGVAIGARRAAGGARMDPAILADFLRGCELIIFDGLDARLKARQIFLGVVERAPNFSRGHSMLAIASGDASEAAAPDAAQALRREAEAQARRALALDPHNGEAYIALTHVAGQQEWLQRERLLLRAIAVDPGLSYAYNNLSYRWGSAGRLQEAISAGRQGLGANDLHPGANYKLATHLADAGRYGEARNQIEETMRRWPLAWVDLARLSLVMIYGSTDEARAALAHAQAHPLPGEVAGLKPWVAFLKARETRDPAAVAEAVRVIRAATAARELRRSDAILALARLDAVDAAFETLEQPGSDKSDFTYDEMFAPPTAKLRQQPRFWRWAASVGLVRYWRETGRWPDVCAGSAGVARCRAEAEAALGPRGA